MASIRPFKAFQMENSLVADESRKVDDGAHLCAVLKPLQHCIEMFEIVDFVDFIDLRTPS